MKVILDWSELELAAAVGLRRQLSSMRDQREDRYGFSGPGWSIHIEGACGELAVAKAMGRYWNGGVDTFKGPDVPGQAADTGSIQVRTRSNRDYDLIVRPNDADQDVFILVTGRAPEFEVHGWIRGREAKQEMWLRTYGDRPPAYFVPQAALQRLG